MPPVRANHRLVAASPVQAHEATQSTLVSNGLHASGCPQSIDSQAGSAESSTSTPVPFAPPPRTPGQQPFRRMQPLQIRRPSAVLPSSQQAATANGYGHTASQPTEPCACAAGYANIVQNQVMAMRSITGNAYIQDSKETGSLQGARRMSVIAATFNDGRRNSHCQQNQRVPSACATSVLPSSPPTVSNPEPSQARRTSASLHNDAAHSDAGDLIPQQASTANGHGGVVSQFAVAPRNSVMGLHDQVVFMRNVAQTSGSQQSEGASSIQGARRMSVIQATFNDGRRNSRSHHNQAYVASAAIPSPTPVVSSQQPWQVRKASVVSIGDSACNNPRTVFPPETASADYTGEAGQQHAPANSSAAPGRRASGLQSQVQAMRNMADKSSNLAYAGKRHSVIAATFDNARA